MSRTIQVTETNDFPVVSSTYNSSDVASVSNLSNGYNPFEHNANYAYIYLKTGESAETKFFFNFAVNIPSESTINSVSCYARASISGTTGVNARRIQLYSGSIAKGSYVTLGTSVSAITSTDLASNTTWTVSELQEAKLYLYATRNSSGNNLTSSRSLKFYGATISINYTYNQVQYEVTATSDLQSITVSSAHEWVNEGADYDLDIFGDITGTEITDNGSSIESSLVTIGTDEYRYSLTNLQTDHSILITLASGNKIFKNINGTWVESSNVYTKLNGTWKGVSKVYKNVSGSWVEQLDISAMFDPNAFFVSG